MSRRSAVATDTGTTGATFALAEAGLGSPPPQPDKNAVSKSNRMSPSKVFVSVWSCGRPGLIEGFDKAKLGLARVSWGLREAVVIRRPLSEGKNDEFTIIVVALGSVPKGWTFKSPLRLRNIAPQTNKGIAGFYSSTINSILKQKKHLPSLQKITFVDPS